jgi:glycosyltransferase involved in cell wall biosynthesis
MGGGISTINRIIAAKLAECGHELQIIAPDIRAEDIERLAGYCCVVAPIPGSRHKELAWARLLFDKIIEFDPDVIIGSDHSTVVSLFPSFARRRACITLSHSSSGVNAKIAAICPDQTDWIVAISHAGKGFLERYIGRPFAGFAIIYNFVEDVAGADALVEAKTREPVVTVTFPGGADRLKRPGTFYRIARALARRDGLRMQWLGNAPGFARRFTAEDAVTFTGKVPNPEAQRLLAASQLFVLPSRREGCPMSLLEAMRGGTVPLVSNCPSAMREIVRDGQNGFVLDGTDPAAFVSRIEALMDDRELLGRLMRNSRQTFVEQLNPQVWLRAFEKLFVPRPNCSRGEEDVFQPRRLIRWQLRLGRWYRPTIHYLCSRLGYLDRRPLQWSIWRSAHTAGA